MGKKIIAMPASGCCCPTTPTSTGSTKRRPAPTRSWSALAPSGVTTPAARPLSGTPRQPRRPRTAGNPSQDHRHRHREPGPAASFFTAGPARKLVSTSSSAFGKASERLSGSATVIDAGEPTNLPAILADLAARGISRLMVEGGATIHNQFLTAGLADELHLVIAPFFIGDPAAPRIPGNDPFPNLPANPMELAEVRRIGNVVLLRYLLGEPRHGLER
jgi:hypothetical protein